MALTKRLSLIAMAAFFVFNGINHFRNADTYQAMIPAAVPFEDAINVGVGTAEIALGLLVLHPRFRVRAVWGLIALLIAVFPANLYVAVTNVDYLGRPTPLINWVRLPFQALFIYWAWSHTQERTN